MQHEYLSFGGKESKVRGHFAAGACVVVATAEQRGEGKVEHSVPAEPVSLS